ncbi:hypothetical protein K3725_03565 [Leisingera sp. S132]|uniref:hypothetical protein n=1 Tax=Leisingera sp. S132 TaxID=2867016 RepID=UPI0021A71244|nr:hypothetical protein [Leisingera sp. S132]UWQ80099.1 hypothetical protein K3725_03565 [Leisingera sp. S132]
MPAQLVQGAHEIVFSPVFFITFARRRPFSQTPFDQMPDLKVVIGKAYEAVASPRLQSNEYASRLKGAGVLRQRSVTIDHDLVQAAACGWKLLKTGPAERCVAKATQT